MWNVIEWVRKTQTWLHWTDFRPKLSQRVKKASAFCFTISNWACETNTHVVNTSYRRTSKNVWSVSQMFGVTCPQHQVLISSDGAWTALKWGNVGCKWAEFVWVSQIQTRSNLRVRPIKSICQQQNKGFSGCRCLYRCCCSASRITRLTKTLLNSWTVPLLLLHLCHQQTNIKIRQTPWTSSSSLKFCPLTDKERKTANRNVSTRRTNRFSCSLTS